MKPRLAVLGLFAVLSIAMTWPLLRLLSTAVSDPGDPFLNVWILDWDWYATFHHPLSLFDANAFYPAKNALALSENLYGIALFLFPLRAIGVSPIAAYNVAMLAGFTLSGFVVYLLGRLVTESDLAGIAAGIFYAFLPFRFTHLSHVQYVWGWTLPLLLYALLRRNAWLFGFAFLINGLSNLHALLFGSIAIVIAALIIRPPWKPFVIATAIAGALLLPFVLPYANGMKRDAAEVMHYSADAHDWIRNDNAEPERRLFPGYVAIIALAASVMHFRRPGFSPALSWFALGLLGSLGLHAFFHRFLFAHVPGFSGMRVPARWAIVAYVGMAVLIAIATSRHKWIAIAVSVAFLIEYRVAPIRWYLAVPDTPPVYAALADAHAPVRAIAELPIDDPLREYVYLLRATSHHKPIANGISGYDTVEHKRLVELSHDQPRFADELRRIGVDRMIVHGESDKLFRVGDGVTQIGEFKSTTGGLYFPSWGETLHGGAFFSGFASSPYGVQRVDLLFNNGAVRLPATVKPGTNLFFAGFPKRPANIRAVADVQVEIVDGQGGITRLEDRWFNWP